VDERHKSTDYEIDKGNLDNIQATVLLKISLIVFLIQALRHQKTEQINDYQSSSELRSRSMPPAPAIAEPIPLNSLDFLRVSILRENPAKSSLMSTCLNLDSPIKLVRNATLNGHCGRKIEQADSRGATGLFCTVFQR
jgi:hypothetical protein